MIEDYSVVHFGSAMFKIIRLLFLAIFCIHFFACVFFAVKSGSAVSPDDVVAFYTSRNVAEDVSAFVFSYSDSRLFYRVRWWWLTAQSSFSLQDLANQYVSTYLQNSASPFKLLCFPAPSPAVCVSSSCAFTMSLQHSRLWDMVCPLVVLSSEFLIQPLFFSTFSFSSCAFPALAP